MATAQPRALTRRNVLAVLAAGGGVMTLQTAVLAADAERDTYVIDALFEAPVEAVWQALTKKSLIDRYYFVPIGADITRAGDDIFYGSPADKLIVGHVLAVDGPRLLRHTFRFTEEADTTKTVVTYTLEAVGTGTRLRIEHRGYAANSQGYADIAGGWPIIVNGMKSVLAGGTRKP